MTESTEHKLRAITHSLRHWSSLDAQTVKMAADEINELRAALASTSTQPTSAVVQEPIFHLRQYGDVTEAEMAQYMATGAIGKVQPTAQPSDGVDMRAVVEALGFDPENHHNAAKCPYCRPPTATVEPTAQHGMPGNVITHRPAWRKALQIAMDVAVVEAPDRDDKSYWAHELAAFDRTFDRLWAMMNDAAEPTAQPWPMETQPDGTTNPVDPADMAVKPTAQPVLGYRYSRNNGKTWHLCESDPTGLMPDKGGIVIALVNATTPPPVAGDAANEAAAKKLYETWHSLPGYVLWQDGGNSLIQDEARKLSRIAAIAAGGSQ